MLNDFIKEIKNNSDEARALHHLKFFKTAKGEYGEGDKFLGLTTPIMRSIVKKYYKLLTLSELDVAIKNPYHEIRAAALCIMVSKYQKGNEEDKKAIFDLYLKNVNYINNWDLVDITAPHLSGHYFYTSKDLKKLYELAEAKHLWSQRIAVLSSFYFIRQGQYDVILKLAKYYLNHEHDLMHKAVGWMLREMGKREIEQLYKFLDENAEFMPRTMLRYSIEKLEERKRKSYLAVKKS